MNNKFRFLFFLLAGQPILEIFGQYLNTSFFHNVVDDYLGDFQFYHCFVGPLPEPILPGGRIGQVQLGNQFTKFPEHYRVNVVVIAGNYFVLIV